MESIKPLMELVSGFGTAAPAIGLLGWLFWQERSERRELSKDMLQMAKDQIESEKEMTAAINMLAAKVSK